MSTTKGGDEHSKKLCALEDEFGNYDVFISHRGPDSKMGFVGYLYQALKRVGLRPFLDCKSISKGQDSWKCIHHAIQMTPLALVIFSKTFAQSEWCLKELHAILNSPSVKLLPIFYKVQPSEVKFPKKDQLDGEFTRLVEEYGEIVIEEWRADLKRALVINGLEYRVGDQRLEENWMQKLVGHIFELANKPLPLDVGDHIVGVKKVAKNLIQALDGKKVLMLGLWGMGGIGKSTLARELFNQSLGRRFDAKCYVEDVAEKLNKGCMTHVQNHVLKALCENELTENIVDKSKGKVILEERLSTKQIFLVLDDVHDNNDMDYLMSRKMLKEGSMCIVTSRNRRVFEKSASFYDNHEILTHEVQFLSKEDSKSAFAHYASRDDLKVLPRFEGLVEDVSMACGGVPLVLEVCGSLLRGEENVEIWKEVLKKLNCGTIMDNKMIFDCLRISYDSLEEEHQEMFLDIACALLGAPVEMAKLVWRSQGWSAALGVRSLLEKALIRVDAFGAFGMHDHLRDMDRAISKQESSIVKRLWGSESLALLNRSEPLPDSLQTLVVSCHLGIHGDLSLVQSTKCWWSLGIHIDLSCFKGLRIFYFNSHNISISSFPKNLRLLNYSEGSHGYFPKVPKNSEMVVLFWTDRSLYRLPKSFGNLRKLEVLNLSNCRSLVGLPNSFEGLQSLKNLNLHWSRIQILPMFFGKLSNLEVLNLSYCYNLKKLPDSFGGLQNLKNLNLYESGIQSLPPSFGKLNLEVLNLGCSCELMELPDSFGDLQNLKIVTITRSGVQCLPSLFGELRNLEELNLDCSRELVELPNSFGDLQNLKILIVTRSGIQSLPLSFGKLSNLEVLNLDYCCKFVEIPGSFGDLPNLKILKVSQSRIQSLPASFGKLSNLEELNLDYCRELVELPNSFGDLQNLKIIKFDGGRIQSLPASFGKLSNLEELNLDFSCELVEIPNSFGDLQNLRILTIIRSGIQSLPLSFGKLSNLEELNLQYCNEFIEIPNSFGDLQSLKILIVTESRIQSLPASFGKLSNLRELNLDCSHGLVELPNSFGDLQNLKILIVTESRIQSLPESFGKLSNLEELNLDYCCELVEIPNSFGNLHNLKILKVQGSGIQSLLKSF